MRDTPHAIHHERMSNLLRYLGVPALPDTVVPILHSVTTVAVYRPIRFITTEIHSHASVDEVAEWMQGKIFLIVVFNSLHAPFMWGAVPGSAYSTGDLRNENDNLSGRWSLAVDRKDIAATLKSLEPSSEGFVLPEQTLTHYIRTLS